MLNPLALPTEVVNALRSVTAIERLLDSRLGELRTELVANRREAEKLPGKVDALRGEVAALRAELAEVRESIEPLEGPAKRMARLSDRLPGEG